MVVSGPQPSAALAARGLPATVKHTLQAHVGAVLAVRFNRTARPPDGTDGRRTASHVASASLDVLGL